MNKIDLIKKCIGAMILLSMAVAPKMDAKIWRVNNDDQNIDPSKNFTSLTDALRSSKVQPGDTLHIEGSTKTYGKDNQTKTDCDTVSKRLVIIGPGYLLDENLSYQTQHNKPSAKIRTLHIAQTAARTVIAGLEQEQPQNNVAATSSNIYDNTVGVYYFQQSLVPMYSKFSAWSYNKHSSAEWGSEPKCYKLRIAADSVTVTHCKLFYVDLYNSKNDARGQENTPGSGKALTNIRITKCFFNPGMICANAGNEEVTNLEISNNFFRNDWAGGSYNTNYMACISFTYNVIDFRGYVPYSNGSNADQGYASVDDNGWKGFYFNKGTKLRNPYQWPVKSPTISNNTFYKSFSIIARGVILNNNIFYQSNTNNAYYYGLPNDLNEMPNTANNNIINNVSLWNAPKDNAVHIYNDNYGGMKPANNEYHGYGLGLPESTWFTRSNSNYLLDTSFELSPGSPAWDKNDKNDKTKQRGMYGGLSPYVYSGLFTIPAVWKIEIPNNGQVPSTGFQVTVSVKSH